MINLYTTLLVAVTLATVLSRRTRYSILYLIVLFVLVAFVVMSFKIDFIGLIFIIVYVGAIATLFLFIVMRLGGEDGNSDPALDLESHNLLTGCGFSAHGLGSLANKAMWYFKHAALDLLIALSMGVLLVEVFSAELVGNFEAGLNVSQAPYISNMFNTAYLYGVFFYNHGYIPFILAAVVLLIAMLGSIILTTRLLLVDGNSSKPSTSEGNQSAQSKSAPVTSNSKFKSSDSLEDYFEKKARAEAAEWKYLPVQFLWTGICFATLFGFKDTFRADAVARYIYLGIGTTIYLAGSFYISKFSKRKL